MTNLMTMVLIVTNWVSQCDEQVIKGQALYNVECQIVKSQIWVLVSETVVTNDAEKRLISRNRGPEHFRAVFALPVLPDPPPPPPLPSPGPHLPPMSARAATIQTNKP